MSRFGNICNVTACNEQHDGIRHKDTQLEYCYSCAYAINRANRPYVDGMYMPFDEKDVLKGKETRRMREHINKR